MIKVRNPGFLNWLLILCLIIPSFSETPVQRHGKLTTDGKYLLNKNGKIVQLRGMSFYWSDPSWNGDQYYTTGIVDFLVDNWKCTVLRVAYGHQAGWNLCETVINQAIKKGI
ncbi:MAG TPA: hypothetical protein VHP36_05160, partial [Chitinispirillaceae bacterium]|nr:hypothetical protein [Chitinispirillaceae bacterium]